MPEFTAPGIGRQSNRVEIDLEIPDNANGVLYALGGAGGGISLYMQDGHLNYLYNMLIIEQYSGRSSQPIPAGKHKIVIYTKIESPGKAGQVEIELDGKIVSRIQLKRTVPAAFSASETFDVGADLGSTVSLDYYDQRPFEFGGTINHVSVELK